MESTVSREVISGVAGAATFAGGLLGLGLPVLLATGASIGVYVGLRLLLAPAASTQRLEPALRATLDEGRKQLDFLRREIAPDYVTLAVRAKVEHIIQIGENILRLVADKPARAQTANRFFGYYLDAAVQIVDKYTDLASVQTTAAESGDLTRKTERALDLVETAFTKQQRHLMEDDVFDLNNEIALLEQTLKMEGVEVKSWVNKN